MSRYTVRNDSDPRSRLIATRRPKEGLLLVSVKSNIHRILINDSILLHGGLNFTSDETGCDAIFKMNTHGKEEGLSNRYTKFVYNSRRRKKSDFSNNDEETTLLS